MGVQKPQLRRQPLTEPTVALEEYLRNVALEVDGDFSRLDVALLTRMLMEMEVKRRTKVVTIFPDTDWMLRSVGSILMEAHDEWQARRRYFSLDSMRGSKERAADPLALPTPLRLAPIH